MPHLRHLLSLGLLTFVLMAPASGAGTDTTTRQYPPAASLSDVKALLVRAPKTHPRLLATSADFTQLRTSLAKSPLRAALARAVIEQADALLAVEPIVHKLQGRRLLGQSRRCVQRTITLSMAYHLTGDKKYVRRCVREMRVAAGFADWNPKHFLDVAEMTLALAFGYDWLYNELTSSERAWSRSRRVLPSPAT